MGSLIFLMPTSWDVSPGSRSRLDTSAGSKLTGNLLGHVLVYRDRSRQMCIVIPIASGVERDNIRHYLKTLRLRHARTPIIYACILRGCRRFVIENSPRGSVSVEIMCAWLEARILRWPLHIVFHRARLVDRFMDWMVACGRAPSNPLQELRYHYGQRTTTPIVCALLSADSTVALELLRPLQAFGSVLGPRMKAHVELMRSLRHRYEA